MTRFTVLAALDLEPLSSLVFDHAVELASVNPGGEVHVVMVAEPQVPIMVYPGLPAPPEPLGADAERVAQFCRDRLQALVEQEPERRLPHVHVHTSVGRPPDEIVWLAAHLDADYVVIGTHGRRGLKRLLMGSVAEKVMRLAGCPVVVLREKSHNPEWKIPEIEPVCPDCAKVREETRGEALWCARHSEHHIRGHALRYDNPASDMPHAWAGITGVR